MSTLNYSRGQVVVGSLMTTLFIAATILLLFEVGASDIQGWIGVTGLALGALYMAWRFAQPLLWRLGMRVSWCFLRAMHERMPTGTRSSEDIPDDACRRRETIDNARRYLGWCIKRTER